MVSLASCKMYLLLTVVLKACLFDLVLTALHFISLLRELFLCQLYSLGDGKVLLLQLEETLLELITDFDQERL